MPANGTSSFETRIPSGWRGRLVPGCTSKTRPGHGAAEQGSPGVYHVVHDQPLAVRQWLPAFAKWLNAPLPPQISVEDALKAGGADAVYYGTQMRGASNAKAKRELHSQPRRLEWIVDAAVAQAN